ncbi:hypothetical protein CJU90_3210 [Yarrowia sp. C11]|nr:hypothetical protein CKK34_4657 [Yarrowia sp. E02]KAG5369706.1 hypothetical protein CJU90_3210 [Yarrowia sp. C11]
MNGLEISDYSPQQLRESRDSESLLYYVNLCFDRMHGKYGCFDKPRFEDMDEFFDNFKHPEAVLSVARDSQSRDIVSICGFRPLTDSMVELKCLCVDAKQEGKGYGAFMTRYVEDKARERGFKTMQSIVIRQHGNLVEFYQKLGYQKMEEKRLIAGGDDMGFGNVVDITIWFLEKELNT